MLGWYLSTYEDVDLKKHNLFYSALRWEEFYQSPEQAEIVILGSSHAYRSYNPMVIDDKLSLENQVFNFGSSAQSPVTSYYVLKEVVQKHRPKLVIFDIYAVVFNYDDQLRNGRINLKEMKWGSNKLNFFWRGFTMKEKATLLFFPTLIYKDFFTAKLKKWMGIDYLPVQKGIYQKRGFVSNPDTLKQEKLIHSNQFDHFRIDPDMVTKRNLAHANKIAKLCKKLQIPLVLMSAPIPEISVQKIDNYKAIHYYFSDLAKELEIPYYDFNEDRISNIRDEFHYYDDDHLNAAGADLFSIEVAKLIKAKLQ